MFIDHWGYTEESWTLGDRPPFVWTWWDRARSATGEELRIHDLDTYRGLSRLERELRPSIDRYRDLLPHEMESRPAFFATHELSSIGRPLDVMAIRGYGYTRAEWEGEGRPPSFLVDREGGLLQFPDGAELGAAARVRPLEPGYGAWWDHSAQIGRVVFITPLGIHATPWTWRTEGTMDVRFGCIRPVIDVASATDLAGHVVALVDASPPAATAERAWIGRRLLASEFPPSTDGVPRWGARTSEIARWLQEARENPAAVELGAIDCPWVPTHRMEFFSGWGDLQDDVMVVGNQGFTHAGWSAGTAVYARRDGEWIYSGTLDPGRPSNCAAQVIETFESRALGLTDPSTGQRHVLVAGSRGVAEVTVGGEPLDWVTAQGRREAATALVKHWMASSDYSFELTARLTAEAMLVCSSDLAWTAVRGDLLAALRGDVVGSPPMTSSAGRAPVDRASSGLHEPPAGAPPLGPPL